MAGHNMKPLNQREIQNALEKPFGTPPISELSRGKKKTAIIFDDLLRPTPVAVLIPFILRELEKGGVAKSSISFVAGTGAHRPMIRKDLVKKLGENIVEEYPVYTHNPFGTMSSLKKVGKTSLGTPVEINREVMESDLKIGIGCIIPHSLAGFTGGAKIVFPGCASIDSIRHNHEELAGSKAGNCRHHPSIGIGKVEGNIARSDMEEAARIIGLDMVVDTVLNSRREIIGVFAGDCIKEHRVGVALAKQVYATKTVRDADVVIANAYPLDSSPSTALSAANKSVRENGDVVLLASSPEGVFLHYTTGRFGREFNIPLPHLPAEKVKRIYLLSRYPTKKDATTPPFDNEERTMWCKSWKEILEKLGATHGENPKVAIYPYTGIQWLND
jgi:nickel-dependent lactate racemase